MDHRELIQAGYRYALSLCHHPSDARDLVQEAWLRLARRRALNPQEREAIYLSLVEATPPTRLPISSGIVAPRATDAAAVRRLLRQYEMAR